MADSYLKNSVVVAVESVRLKQISHHRLSSFSYGLCLCVIVLCTLNDEGVIQVNIQVITIKKKKSVFVLDMIYASLFF